MKYPALAAPSDRFLIATGALALNWAVSEAMLDFAVAVIFHTLPYSGVDKHVPQALGRKIKLIRKGLAHADLAFMRERGLALMDDLWSHKDDRNKIVHGAIVGEPEGDSVLSMRVKYLGRSHSSSLHTVTAEEVERYAETALELSGRVTSFTIRLVNTLRPDEDPIDYPLREFAD